MYLNYLFLLLCCLTLSQLVQAGQYRSEHDVGIQMLKYIRKTQSDADKAEFEKIIEILSFPKYIYRAPFSSYSKGRQALTCTLCRSSVQSVLNLHAQGSTEEELIASVTDLCVMLEIQPKAVCRGVVELNLPIIMYIIDNTPEFKVETFCGVVLQTRDPNSCPFQDNRFEWSVNLPAKKAHRKTPALADAPSFKIAQISDVHYDPVYEAGGLAECNEPTCCRKGQTEEKSRRWRMLYDDTSAEDRVHLGEDGLMYIDIDYADDVKELKREARAKNVNRIEDSKKAGYWGDYRDCDTPWWAFEDGLDHVAENHKDIDFVYYTGDTVDHGVWETTQEMITESLNDTLNKFKLTFGNKAVYPVIGNHESQPMNQYAPAQVTDPKFSTNWLYNLLADKWGVWLPAQAAETIKLGGYYTVLVRPGFRLVTLNNNLCYVYNWWVHYNPNDPNGQLKWLVSTLLQAENNNEKVHILAHIPAGSKDCFFTYTREYKRIIERFSDTIAAEFNGHTHNDEFKIFYEKKNTSNPINVAWNGGSLTAYSDVNPNYRIYEVDSETFDVVDFQTWVYNLTDANLHPQRRPEWFVNYAFKRFYGLDSLKPVDLDKLLKRMVTDEKSLLVQNYHLFRGKSSDIYANINCNDNCVKKNICYMTGTELYDDRTCERLWQMFSGNFTEV